MDMKGANSQEAMCVPPRSGRWTWLKGPPQGRVRKKPLTTLKGSSGNRSLQLRPRWVHVALRSPLARSGLEKGTQKPLNPNSSASEHLRKMRTIESCASKCWVTGGYWVAENGAHQKQVTIDWHRP